MNYMKIVSYSNVINSYLENRDQKELFLRYLKNFLQIFDDFPIIFDIINSPVISVAKKRHLISQITVELSFQYIQNILIYILKKESNLLLLKDIFIRLEELCYQNFKVKVIITTATSLQLNEKKDIENFLLKNLHLFPICHFKVDEKLSGGFIIEYNNNLLDFSLVGILQKMQHSILSKYLEG